MIRYTDEQKAQALQSVEEIGVKKTSEALGITVNTLYKWKNATEKPAEEQSAEEKPARKPRAARKTAGKRAKAEKKPRAARKAKAAVVEPETVEAPVAAETPVVDADVRALLAEDDRDERIQQLEDENARLRASVSRLKTALNALLG